MELDVVVTDRVGDSSGVINLIQMAQEARSAGRRRSPDSDCSRARRDDQRHRGSDAHSAGGRDLSQIAQKYYRKASEHPTIFEANRDQLTDPDKIREGITLRIP